MHLLGNEERLTQTSDAAAAARALREAAQLNREDPIRSGSLLNFGTAGQLVVTGDMHGNIRNFEKLQRFCALERSPGRSVILHELIHAEPAAYGEPDLSIDLLIAAARWKCEFPDNVFFIQSNHELSQLRGHEIVKGGRSVLREFEDGVKTRFGREAHPVLNAVHDYIDSLPLAARTANGIFVAHSLPNAGQMDHFDFTVFDRCPTDHDLDPGGAAHALVWGRFQPPEYLDKFAERLGVETFIVGHTPQEFGYTVSGRMIVLASDHAHGVFLPLDLSRKYAIEDLVRAIRKFAGVE